MVLLEYFMSLKDEYEKAIEGKELVRSDTSKLGLIAVMICWVQDEENNIPAVEFCSMIRDVLLDEPWTFDRLPHDSEVIKH
jgi:hypothetical protein